MNFGEPLGVIFHATVYEGEVFEALGWGEAEIDSYHDANDEARQAVRAKAVEIGHGRTYSFPTEDTKVIIDGGEL